MVHRAALSKAALIFSRVFCRKNKKENLQIFLYYLNRYLYAKKASKPPSLSSETQEA
jgi:hypothetical protein